MPEKDTKSGIKLTPEDTKMLINLKQDIEKAEKAIRGLGELDIDTTQLMEKVAWAKKARDVLLGEFT